MARAWAAPEGAAAPSPPGATAAEWLTPIGPPKPLLPCPSEAKLPFLVV